jgi:hypothetical protein
MTSSKFSLLWASLFLGAAAAFSQHQSTRTTGTTTTTRVTTKSLRAVMVNIDENFPRDVWAMDEYMTNCGVQRADGLSLYDSSIYNQEPETDFGLMTQADLPAQSPVLCVPANMILSSKELREGELRGIVEPAEEYLEILGVAEAEFPMYHLFLKILLEYESGEESPWFPWLNSLPRRYSNGASMTRA